MENGEGGSHNEGRHALRREPDPQTDIIAKVDPDLAERMRKTRIYQLAVGVPTAIAITL